MMVLRWSSPEMLVCTEKNQHSILKKLNNDSRLQNVYSAYSQANWLCVIFPIIPRQANQKKSVIITYLCVMGEVPVPRLLRCNYSGLLKGCKIVMQNSSYLISAKKYIRGVHKKYYREPGRLHRARQVLTLFAWDFPGIEERLRLRLSAGPF